VTSSSLNLNSCANLRLCAQCVSLGSKRPWCRRYKSSEDIVLLQQHELTWERKKKKRAGEQRALLLRSGGVGKMATDASRLKTFGNFTINQTSTSKLFPLCLHYYCFVHSAEPRVFLCAITSSATRSPENTHVKSSAASAKCVEIISEASVLFNIVKPQRKSSDCLILIHYI